MAPNEKRKLLRLEALVEQQRKEDEEFLQDIERIAQHGPDDSERDDSFVRRIFNSVACEIYLRRCLIANSEGE